ncbi:type VII secretion protein EssC [Fictibacillus gelatini]|uniref:type VII secretion protein EssC n=1 Tax=Fictibacillus gelatini TaxID=225985 RepID=UPI0004271B89|nr:type VII secretion protein EssC [Fictibacillus gelatini]
MAQRLLLISDGIQLHKCHLNINEQQKITIGNDWSHTLTFPKLDQPLDIEWDGEMCKIGNHSLLLNKSLTVHHSNCVLKFHLMEFDKWLVYDTSPHHRISFGTNEYDDVKVRNTKVDMALTRQELGQAFRLEAYNGEVYHNCIRLEEDVILQPGDQVFFDGVLIQVGKNEIRVLPSDTFVSTKLMRIYDDCERFNAEYPDYHRSPRIIYREPTEKRRIAKPSSKPRKPSEQLARVIVPPLVMVAVMILISFFRPSGIYIIAMLSMTIVTVIFSITTYIKSLKQYRKDIKERDESYREYLKQKTKELYEASEQQRHALNYHYPTVKQIRDMAVNVDSRIYEKTMFHHDFLMYRVGLGWADSSFEIEFSVEEFTQEKDELVEAARELRSQYAGLKDVPVVTSLTNGPVGYIGERRHVIEQLQLLVMQTAFFHSYYDLQFITIFPEEEKANWEWMRWLPHASLREMNVRGFVYHERSRDQVLNTLYQILKERKLAVDEKSNSNEKLYFSPHFVVLITDEKLILDHTVMEYFNDDPSELGVSLVFVQDVMQSLPEHVKTVIDIRDVKNGNIILEEGELVNRKFTLDHFPEGFNKEDVSRALAPLNHLQNLKNSIPESVTFLEMYGVEKVEELEIAGRWAKNETYKSLAVPLGLRGKEDIVNLNLHEKAHGPHGLIAGTTGSGKSEIIQSYILSLAVNFHPHEVAFLLIDYKGGGMANLFRQLPHLLGTITNLDGAQSMRALASIKAELQKRQRLFGEHHVNHINQYQKLYKQGEASEPMPHLFLISDEFAELKAEQPDFMKELVSTARIGRSLGIHLILATQKPSGVVDDQIWSNSKFKLALKVQNASDSNEILKTPDAADITLPGRAYLQVGNNEIYELFQSAWSGAQYVPDKHDETYMDTTIYAINELGQYDILSDDLSGLAHQQEISKVSTELDAVIEYIHAFTKEQNIAELPRPWLPPLEEMIFLPDLHQVDYKKAWYEEKKPLIATIGLLDIPEMQAQEPLSINLTKDGHLAVFSSPGYGKSTFLQSIAMDIARQHSPERLHMYLIDLGTNGLLPLKELPHVADTIMVDEETKLLKLLRRLRNELKERKQKLSKFGVANISMYERASGEEVPTILLIIDTIDSVGDATYKEEFEKVTAQIAREGAGVGIHMAISAGRQNAMRAPLLANIKNQISLYMIDEMEPRNIVGRTALTIEELPGRGLVKLEQPTAFQTALPVKGKDTLAIIEGIQNEGKEMRQAWKGEVPLPIPMVPETVEFSKFINEPETKAILEKGGIPFAVDFENVKPVELMINQNTLILGSLIDSVEQTYLTLLSIISDNRQMDIGMIDNSSGRFGSFKNNVDIYADSGAAIEDLVDRLQALSETREDAFREVQRETDGRATMGDFLKEIRPMIVFITDASFVIDSISLTAQTALAKLIETGSRVGIHFIIGAVYGAIERLYDDISNILKKQKIGVLIGRISDQNMLEVMNRPYKENNLLPYEAYYIQHGKAEKIKIVAPQQKRKDVNAHV